MADKSDLPQYLNRQGDQWKTSADIKAVLADIPDRTLRRWLAELVQDGKVERAGDRKGTRYRWQPEPASVSAPAVETSVFTPASLRLLERVTAPLYTRPPVTYSEKWVESYVPNRTFYLSAASREQLRLEGKRPPIHGRAGTYIQKILNRLLIDLSYHSSRLEGNTYTLADTEQLLLRGVGAAGKASAERIMILNHREAISYLVRNATNIAATEETIRTLHYLLADGLVAPGMAGHIRDESIAVSGTTYAPLEGKERLTRLLDALLAKSRRIEDPFEQSLFLLGHISYLQAFVDVNKRTARLASIIPLIKNDYVPQSFIDVDKDDYLKATICFYEFNETAPLADLYRWSYLRACKHYDTSAQVIEFDEIAALYRRQRRALVAAIVRERIAPADAAAYLAAHLPPEVAPEHRTKFIDDAMAEIEHLDVSRIAGMGLSAQELKAWMKLRGG